MGAIVCASVLAGCARAPGSFVLPSNPSNGASDARQLTPPTFRHLFSFNGVNGAYPAASLIGLDGKFYGTTAGGGPNRGNSGTIFMVTQNGKERIIYDFGTQAADGASPWGLTELNGTLYGTTQYGGKRGLGTVFTVSTSGKERVLYSFQGYTDGSYPTAGLTVMNGTFYGTTSQGGAHSDGTVFKIAPGGKEEVLYSFAGASDGKNPLGLIAVGDMLYGTTSEGGDRSCSCGTVFSVTPSGKEAILHRFEGGPVGASPAAALTDANGTLYGAAEYGGGSNLCHQQCGIVFKIATDGKESWVYSFKGMADGAHPEAPLLFKDGILYGTTHGGGDDHCYSSDPNGCGTIFEITLAGKENVLYRFKSFSTTGGGPQAGLAFAGGKLYGTTAGGGPFDDGTAFTISP